MNYYIRPLISTDELFLWELLYQAIYIPEGNPVPLREVVHTPELARYVQNWGRKGDSGFLAIDTVTGQPVGGVWLRLLTLEEKGYGYIDDTTPELSIAILPDYRGCGIGSLLLTHLFNSAAGYNPISLSVSIGNKAITLYERFGFTVVYKYAGSLTMKRDLSNT